MSESAADLLQALQQKAATGLQSIKQAVHEYETWLADATVQARQRLRSLPSAQLGGNSAPTISATVNKEVLEPRRPAPAGKRRRKASPVLATVAEEEDAEQVQEGEGIQQAEPQASEEQPAEQKPARRQPARKAKAKTAAVPAPAATTKRRTRAQAKAAAREGSGAPSEAASDVAVAQEDSRQIESVPQAELAEQEDHPSADDRQDQQSPGRNQDQQSHAHAARHQSNTSCPVIGSLHSTPLQVATSQNRNPTTSPCEAQQGASAPPHSQPECACPHPHAASSAETGTGDRAGSARGSASVISEALPAEATADQDDGMPAHGALHQGPNAAAASPALPQPAEPAVQHELELVLDMDASEGSPAPLLRGSSAPPEQPAAPPEQLIPSAASPAHPQQQAHEAMLTRSASGERCAATPDPAMPGDGHMQNRHLTSRSPSPEPEVLDLQLSSADKAASPDADQQHAYMSQPHSSPAADEPDGGHPGSPADGAEAAASPDLEQSQSAAPSGVTSQGSKTGGLNLVSAIRSFLPGPVKSADNAPPKKAVKVKALEAAEAARQRDRERAVERARQKQALEQQKVDRARQVQEAKARQEREQQRKAEQAKLAMQRREEEAAAARRAREEAEKRERREKQQRQEEARQQKRQQEQRAEAQAAHEKKSQAEEDRKRKAQAAIARELEAKRAKPAASTAALPGPVQPPVQTSRASAMPPPAAPPAHRPAFPAPAGALAAQAARTAGGSALPPSRLQQASFATDPPPPLPPSATPAQGKQRAARPKSTQRKTPAEQRVMEDPSYEISPYRGDSEDSEDEEEDCPQEKRVPAWARGQELMQGLHAQLATDPDEIFQQRQRTCALDDVFSAPVRPQPGKRDLKERRTSTSNWIEDRVTWQEEKLYKKAMGYMK